VFATWCPPCRIELPEVVRSYDRYKAKVVFLGVDERNLLEKSSRSGWRWVSAIKSPSIKVK
jgi:thiol-disulfide isomerase/thioredoxin